MARALAEFFRDETPAGSEMAGYFDNGYFNEHERT
jgi:hypothetical protein